MNQGKPIKFSGSKFVAVATLVIFLGYGPMAPRAQADNHQGSGLYWWGKVGYECYNSRDCGGMKKLKAYVGLPVDWGAKARCVGGGWSIKRVEVATGALPPGLRFGGKYNTRIVGVPKRAGTWYLRIRFLGVRCAGKYYGDKTQDLAITAQGSSAPRSLR